MSQHYNNLWWAIDGFLAGMGIPYIDQARRYNLGGDLEAYHDELPMLHRAGIRAVVCLLNIPGDIRIFQSAGFGFKCLPVDDGSPPDLDQTHEFVEFVNTCRSRNLPVAVFCEAGAGRTGTLIATYLIHSGMSAAQAIAHVRSREASAVERVHQIRFLEEYEELQKGHER